MTSFSIFHWKSRQWFGCWYHMLNFTGADDPDRTSHGASFYFDGFFQRTKPPLSSGVSQPCLMTDYQRLGTVVRGSYYEYVAAWTWFSENINVVPFRRSDIRNCVHHFLGFDYGICSKSQFYYIIHLCLWNPLHQILFLRYTVYS